MTALAVHGEKRYVGAGWPAWRLHRTALFTSAAVLGGLVIALLVTGLKIRDAFSAVGLDTCGPHCTDQQYETFTAQANTWGLWTQYFALLPGLLGMFVGAPLVAREYETGTFRFAFTQGITPLRLIVTKLLLLGGALVAMTLAFGALFHWWYTPIADSVKDRLGPWAYQADGVYLAAGTLFAFAFGVLVGAVIRRTVPAMLVTLVFWAVTFGVDWKVVRPTFEAPIVAPTSDLAGTPARPWIVDAWHVDPAGHRLSNAEWNALVAHEHTSGYVAWSSFEPGDRFWHFQLLDAAGLVTGAVLFALAAIWWLRRRPT